MFAVFDKGPISWKSQSEEHIKTVENGLQATWEYEGGKLSRKRLTSHVRLILRRHRSKLRRHWKTVNQCDRTFSGPEEISPDIWPAWVQYWSKTTTMELSNWMTKTRAKVTNTTRFGRGGVARAEKRTPESMDKDALISLLRKQLHSTQSKLALHESTKEGLTTDVILTSPLELESKKKL